MIVASPELRHVSGCIATEATISELERCSVEGITCIEGIVGVDREGNDKPTDTSRELEQRGKVWADHVLESPRSWALCALYVLVTVTLGVAPVTYIATALDAKDHWLYVSRGFDALIYIWLAEARKSKMHDARHAWHHGAKTRLCGATKGSPPFTTPSKRARNLRLAAWTPGLAEITTALLRVVQKRPLYHRMGGRTVVIGDVPWVAQSAEAFLSKVHTRTHRIPSRSILKAMVHVVAR